MLLIRLAWRNLWRQRRRSLLTAGSMILGFLLISVSFGLQEGSYGQLINLFTQSYTGHVQIHADDYREHPSLYKTLKEPDLATLDTVPFINAWTPRVYSGCLAFAHDRALGIGLVGLDIKREQATTTLAKRIDTGRFFKEDQLPEALVSFALSQRLQLNCDDELLLMGQGADGSIANNLFKVIGIVGKKDDHEPDLIVYLPLGTAQTFLSLDDRVHEVAIMTDSYKHAEQYADELTALLAHPAWEVEPWQVVKKSFYNAMQADRKSLWISVFIIMLIVGIGVLNTVLMNLLERTPEFGMMLALGTRPLQLFAMIYLELTLLVGLAIAIGSVLSLGANSYLYLYGIKLGEPLIFSGVAFDTYRSVINAQIFWLPALFILGTTWIVALRPTLRLVRIPGLEALTHI